MPPFMKTDCNVPAKGAEPTEQTLMPQVEATHFIPRPVAEVFEFFRRTANLPRVVPPELQLRLEAGPERLVLGSRVTVTGRRWGVPQRVVSEVTALEPDALLVVEQRAGPLRKWVHAHRFEVVPGGTRVTERVEFEPPGGILGMVMNAAALERDLRWAFEYRAKRLQELLGDGDGSV
jgi:ligand-binding SRPBCC domain-containing protein